MQIKTAEYLISATELANAPHLGDKPEIVMLGRSNVGKSSLINALCHRKNLAHTSNTPGKTRKINYYNINDTVLWVDLPGYGYAKVSKTEQAHWQKALSEYLLHRESIVLYVVLMDARHGPTPLDEQMLTWLHGNDCPTLGILNKSDQVKSTKEPLQAAQAIWPGLTVLPFSARDPHKFRNSLVPYLLAAQQPEFAAPVLS